MSTGWTRSIYVREMLLALVVVALGFFSFAHPGAIASDHPGIHGESWCGEPMLPGPPDHPPCHACRIGSGADLPPPPAAVTPVTFAAVAVVYETDVPVALRPVALLAPQPRGPPAFV